MIFKSQSQFPSQPSTLATSFLTAEPATLPPAVAIGCRSRGFRRLFETSHGAIQLNVTAQQGHLSYSKAQAVAANQRRTVVESL